MSWLYFFFPSKNRAVSVVLYFCLYLYTLHFRVEMFAVEKNIISLSLALWDLCVCETGERRDVGLPDPQGTAS